MVSYRPAMMPSARLRPRSRTGVALSAAIMLVAWSVPLSAAQAVAVGEVTVTGSGDAAFAEGMRTTLVRLTGRRRAAEDPVFAPLIAGARRYVQVYRPAAGTTPARITFDAAAIERAVVALGQPVWSRTRPVLLGVVTRPPEGADPVRVRAALETAALERGLPLRLATAASAGLADLQVVSAADALAAARRLGADALLLGSGDGTEWQWTLFEAGGTTVLTGGVTDGIEGAADQLALGAAAPGGPGLAVEMDVQGIDTLADLVRAQRLLESLPGARQVGVIAVGGAGTRFRLEIPRGAEGLAEALLTRPGLSRVGGASSLVYRLGR
jgi:hypothetical protein